MQLKHAAVLEAAVAALNEGDAEPLLGLMSGDMVWSGFPRLAVVTKNRDDQMGTLLLTGTAAQ